MPCVAGFLRSSETILRLLDNCHLGVIQAKQIQALLVVSGTIRNPLVAGRLITFYSISALGDLGHAYLVFRSFPIPTTFIWNTVIRAFSEHNKPLKALSLYRDMLACGLSPNNYTYSFCLKACLDLSSILDGQKIHAQIIRLGWESYDFVLNGLIHMYSTFHCVASAFTLFDSSSYRDVISWTAMVCGYAKVGKVTEALELFDLMPHRNVISWSAMINCYSQLGMCNEALELFNRMQLDGIKPLHGSIVGVLSACASLGALDQGKWIHAYVNRNKIRLDGILGTALIDMYAKCGSIETAYELFSSMPERDVFTWTSMISGLANHGYSWHAIEFFEKMQDEGISPNEITFICILNACSRMGLVEEGKKIFASMRGVYGIEPGVEHYGCLVDLLSHAGQLTEAKKIVCGMPVQPDSYVLGALLNGCKMHGMVELGERIVRSLVCRGLDHGGVYALISNIYAHANRWQDVAKIRKEMDDREVGKECGCSLIEVAGVAVVFAVGHTPRVIMEEIMITLHGIDKQFTSCGYGIFDWEYG